MTETLTPTQLPKVVGPEGRLHPIAQRALQASPRDRMAMVLSDCTIHYPVMDQILADAEWMVYEPRQTRARGMAVCAGRGNGKTSLANLIHRPFQDYDDPDRTSTAERRGGKEWASTCG